MNDNGERKIPGKKHLVEGEIGSKGYSLKGSLTSNTGNPESTNMAYIPKLKSGTITGALQTLQLPSPGFEPTM